MAAEESSQRRVAVLGASGGVGRRIVARALDRGHAVACQTRDARRLADLGGRADVHAFAPTDADSLDAFVRGCDVVVFALGIDSTGATTLFSDATAALLPAMARHGVKRLIAITGIGAGDTRGHGGFFYDRIIFPLFTLHRYADKDRQEALIAASDRDWIIVRPAPYNNRPAPGPLQVHTEIAPDTMLRCVTRDEVADFVVDQVTSDRYLRQRPFIGHP
jgi:putative NADH-flavin reductase